MMNLLQVLKADTQDVHHSLEKKLDLLNDSYSQNSYRNLLCSFYGFYRPFEKLLAEAGLPVSYPRHERLPALIEDLKYLGLSHQEIENLPLCQDVIYSTKEEITGALYVMEGSALGGLVLTKHFGEKFGFTPHEGISFFYGLGKETMPYWKHFQESVQKEFEKGHLKEKEIIQSAKETFIILGLWLGN